MRRLGAISSGLLLAASRPSIDIGWLALVGLVPLLLAVKGQRIRTAALLGFLAGCAYYGVVVSWAWYFGAVAIVPFAMVLAAYWAVATASIAALAHRGRGSSLLAPAVWILTDSIVARWPLGGFSWGELGYAAHDIAPLRSLAGLGGLSLVSFTIVLCNAAIAELIARRSTIRLGARANFGAIGAIAVIFAAVIATTTWFVTWPRMHASGTMKIAALQGNNINRDLTDREIADFTLPNNHFALANALQGDFDLIVFPESGFHPETIDNPRIISRLGAIARQRHSYVLANGVHDLANGKVNNRNIVVGDQGMIVASYDKRHLVPFGEYVPWRSTLQGLISELKRIPRDFAPGTTAGVVSVHGHRVSQVICFESAFGYAVRRDVGDGAELIIVSTNNRSYRRSANSAQHIAIAQLRAAETGRSVVQASVSGTSAVIDDRGTIVATTSMFHNAALVRSVTTRTGSTFYVRHGEWVAWLCALALGAIVAARGVSQARSRSNVTGAGPSTLVPVNPPV